MNKIFNVLLVLIMICGSMNVFAEEGTFFDEAMVAAEGEASEETAADDVFEENNVSSVGNDEEAVFISQKEVMFHAEIVSDEICSRHFIFELYASDGQTMLKRLYINTEEWATSFKMVFSVPEYNIGEKFILKLISDNAKLSFNGFEGKEVVLETYLTADDEGNAVYQTAFYGNIIPDDLKMHTLKVYNHTADADYKIFGDEIYVSEDFIKELKINILKEEGTWFLSSQTEGLSMQFFDDNIYACKNGKGYNLKYPVFTEEGKGYLPLYEIAEYFSCAVDMEETETGKIINTEYSVYGIVISKESFVNESGVESRTDYLIWISKKDHTVNVFNGKAGLWHLYKSYPCALGAPRTPTIEGEFEYIERLNRWTYPNYYCGPVMRFYRGYALHSTLIKYNGTPYDDRVGVDISLGCIRLHPEDINELIEFIPFNTKIYITKD